MVDPPDQIRQPVNHTVKQTGLPEAS
jgi:hypothetical protein